MKNLCLAALAIVALAISGCAAQLIRTPVPQSLVNLVQVRDLPNVRYWGDELPKDLDIETDTVFEQSKARRPHLFKNGIRRQANFLAISGGGSDGAFGAGLISGWTARPDRPEFDIVTGISTGALAAPFVFLGSKYDPQLREIYTSYSTDQLVEPQVIAGLLGGASIADDTKFQGMIAKYVTHEMLREIAREYDRGRRLLIGTTNLDAGRPVVWDMGKIAKRGDKHALHLFRKILQGSASIPAVFPPVKINVTADGKILQELHVDGGTTGQVFFLPPQFMVDGVTPNKKRKHSKSTKLNLYVVMNMQLSPRWSLTEATTTSIAKRSLTTLMKRQAIGDLYQLYVSAKENHMDYNVASIPRDFDLVSKEPFDIDYMRALFKVGYELGAKGYPWLKEPPGLPARASR